MIGAIIGDVVGSPYEFLSIKAKEHSFPLFSHKSHFTDDTVHTLAIANAIMHGYKDEDLTREYIIDNLHEYSKKYPDAGYGCFFQAWIASNSRDPYYSYGNGSAMRVASIAWAFDTLDDVQKYAKISAEVTHNHPEGIKGAVATASAIFLARAGIDFKTLEWKTVEDLEDITVFEFENMRKQNIKEYITKHFGYNLERDLSSIRYGKIHDETCQNSVPQAITAFLRSRNYEDCIRKAVSLGGDTDTIAAIAGSIAEAFYGEISKEILDIFNNYLDDFTRGEIKIFEYWLANGKKSARKIA